MACAGKPEHISKLDSVSEKLQINHSQKEVRVCTFWLQKTPVLTERTPVKDHVWVNFPGLVWRFEDTMNIINATIYLESENKSCGQSLRLIMNE